MDNIKANILKELILSSEENFEIARDIAEHFEEIVKDAIKEFMRSVRNGLQLVPSGGEFQIGKRSVELILLKKNRYNLVVGISKDESLYYGIKIDKPKEEEQEKWNEVYNKLKRKGYIPGAIYGGKHWPWFWYYSGNIGYEGLVEMWFSSREELFNEVVNAVAQEIKANLLDKLDEIERILREFQLS